MYIYIYTYINMYIYILNILQNMKYFYNHFLSEVCVPGSELFER